MVTKRRSHSTLGLVAALLLGLVGGLLYVFLVPPWQHYDEPNHFEAAWWLANYRQTLQEDDYDQEMRREVQSSMIAHDFFRGMGWVPDPETDDEPLWIGRYSQADEPLLYYAAAAVPIYLLQGQDIDIQLYAARLVSLGLLLVTIASGYGLIVELTSEDNPLRWMVPVSMAVLPGFVELMTAVNNDVGAIAASSASIWLGVRLVRRGLSPLRLIAAGFLVILCILTKETAYPAALMLLGACILAEFHKNQYRKYAWIILGSGVVLVLLASMEWGDAALWYRNTYQGAPTRTLRDNAPFGEAVFLLVGGELEGNQWINKVQQLIPSEDVVALQGQPVTIGAWIWAERDGEHVRFSLTAAVGNENYMQSSESFVVTAEPVFYALQAAMPVDATQSWVTITPEGYGTFYLDGMVMVMGSYPLNEAPQPADAFNDAGEWGGSPYVNILRGSSAENSWPRMKPWVDRLGSRFLPDRGRPSMVLYSLLDREAGGWYYTYSMRNLQQTFWGKFGWGHIPLMIPQVYGLLNMISIAGILGAVLGLRRDVRKFPWEALIFLGVTMLAVWGMALIRGAFYMFSTPFIPSARYGFPAIIPTLGLFCLGWWKLGDWIKEISWTHFMKRVPEKLGLVVYWSCVIMLNILAVLTVYQYYYGNPG